MLDGFLIINGSYSENNTESIKLTNWLFRGFSGQALYYNLNGEPRLSDSVFLITQDGLKAIVDPPGAYLVKSKITSLKENYLFVPTQEEFDDK